MLVIPHSPLTGGSSALPLVVITGIPPGFGGLEASCWDFSSPMNLCLSGLPKVKGKVRLEKGVGSVPPHQPWRKSSPEGSSEDTEAHRPEPNMLLHMPSPGHLQVIYLTRLQQSKNPRAEGWSPPAPAVTQPGCFSTLLMGFGMVGTCSPTFTLVPGGGESSFQACRWQHDSHSP